jgi:hypothetical protein
MFIPGHGAAGASRQERIACTFCKLGSEPRGAALPPDLFDASLAGMRTPNSDRESVIIDIDHFRDNADLDPDPSQVQQLIVNSTFEMTSTA